jgi:hypothetical protein
MQLNRRAFFHGLAASVATVAIAMRMAPKFPDVLADGTWRYEMASDNYYYGIDTAKPWNVQVFTRADAFSVDPWTPIDPRELMRKAKAGLVDVTRQVKVGYNPDDDFRFVCDMDERLPCHFDEVTHEEITERNWDPSNEEIEAVSVIAMSQGFAALNAEGDGPFAWPPDSVSIDVVTLPKISTTKAEMFPRG